MQVGECLGCDTAGRAVWVERKTDTETTVAVRDASGVLLISMVAPATKQAHEVLAMLADYSAPEKTPTEKRAARYKVEADPLLLAVMGYSVEYESDPTQQTLDKLTRARSDYLSAKARIRAEIP
jgi:hypothetical protein